MNLVDAAQLVTLRLEFHSDPPVENTTYLVVGKLEAPNGFTGPYMIVCEYSPDGWWVGPDGPLLSEGLSMYDGLSGNVPAAFAPIKWAALPPCEE